MGERSGRLDTSAFTLCIGSEASTAVLREDLSPYSVLHCGAHGYVDPAEPRNTGIALSTAGLDSGFLSIADVLGMKLQCELVVLSACETAQGKILRGEGVQSMANAFLEAGARSVVASLWKVRDLETADLMQRFYEHLLQGGLSPPAALRAAKIEYRSAEGARGLPASAPATAVLQGEHPYFWASYVYVGMPSSAELCIKATTR